jgi:hypothetical protein
MINRYYSYFDHNVINFKGGIAAEDILCRFSGYMPPAAPDRKAAVQAVVA